MVLVVPSAFVTFTGPAFVEPRAPGAFRYEVLKLTEPAGRVRPSSGSWGFFGRGVMAGSMRRFAAHICRAALDMNWLGQCSAPQPHRCHQVCPASRLHRCPSFDAVQGAGGLPIPGR